MGDTKINLPVTGLDAQITCVPEFYHTDNVQALYNSLHGSGLFPVVKNVNGKVVAGTGLNVVVKDFLGAIMNPADGGIFVVYLGSKRKLDNSTTVTVNVSSFVGHTGYIIITPTIDKNNRWNNGAGVVKAVLTLPDAYILLATLVVPGATTQITQTMIDESGKDYLANIDEISTNMQNYVNAQMLIVKAELLTYVNTTLTTQLRTEIANGDAGVLAQLNSAVAGINAQILLVNTAIANVQDGLSVANSELLALRTQVNTLSGLFDALNTYVNAKIALLSSRTDALESWQGKINSYVDEDTVWRNAVDTKMLQFTTDIEALVAGLNEVKDQMVHMNNDIRGYVDEQVAFAKLELYDFITGQFTTQIRTEIANGDAGVLAELNGQTNLIRDSIRTIQDRIDAADYSIQGLLYAVGMLRPLVNELNSYVYPKVVALENRSAALELAMFGDGEEEIGLVQTVANNSAFDQQVANTVGKNTGDIAANQIQIENALARISALELGGQVTSGLGSLNAMINIAKTNFKIDAYHTATANDMFKGYVDVLNDKSRLVAESKVKIDGGRLVVNSAPSLLPAGVIGYYNLNEGQGNVALDGSTLANHAVIRAIGNPWTPNGKYNGGLQWDGGTTQAYVAPPFNEAYNFDDFSIESWIYWHSSGYTYSPLIASRYRNPDDSANLMWLWLPWTLNTRQFAFYAGGSPWLIGPVDMIPADEWAHIAISKTGTIAKMYANGVLKATGTGFPAVMPKHPSTSIRFGSELIDAGNPLYNAFNGKQDEFVLYNRGLTDQEVLAHAQNPFGSGYTYPIVVLTTTYDPGVVPATALLVADSFDVTYKISRDGGTTWTTIVPNTELSISGQPSGQSVILKMNFAGAASYVDQYAVFVTD
jgi:hypothetical protein